MQVQEEDEDEDVCSIQYGGDLLKKENKSNHDSTELAEVRSYSPGVRKRYTNLCEIYLDDGFFRTFNHLIGE